MCACVARAVSTLTPTWHARAGQAGAGGTSAASGKEGLSIHEVDFRADIDMPVFKVGGTSIGSVQFTDFAIKNTTMMVYGH